MKYKAIIYDIDGTVIDSFKMNFIPLQQLVKERLNKDIEYNELLNYVTYPGIKIMEELGFKDVENEYPLWVERVNNYPGGATIHDNIETLLKQISLLNIPQAVVSSKKRPQYKIDIIDKGLDQYFDVVILEEDTLKHKPDPEPLLTCLNQLGLNKEDVIYIGDGYSDYECCLNAGIDFGYASWGSVEKRKMDATHVLNDPLDLLKII